MDIIEELKARARVLHRRALSSEPEALARVHTLPGLAGTPASEIKRRHCLAVVARELGFDGWSHLKAVLDGAPCESFGTLLNDNHCGAHWNIWSASYEEARTIRAEHGGYLLAWRHQFLIVDRYYVETLGLDPDDPDWEKIGRDWVRPDDPGARRRLYEKLIRSRAA
jgi:hypothetical protein